MSNNLYLYDKLYEARRREIQLEIEQQRLAAKVPQMRRNMVRHSIRTFGTGLVWFGSWLEQIEHEAMAEQSHSG